MPKHVQFDLIEQGWLSLEKMAVPAEAGAVQRNESRRMFFAGARHLFSSIMVVLDPEAEPTERDLLQMTAIEQELEQFWIKLQRGQA